MHQFPAAAVLLQQLHRVLPGMNDPENVHLVTDIFGVRFRHQQVEERSVAMRLEFVSMGMVKEFQSVLRQRFTCPIKYSRRVAAGFFVEVSLVRNPRAAGILQAQRLGLAGDALDVITVALEAELAGTYNMAP